MEEPFQPYSHNCSNFLASHHKYVQGDNVLTLASASTSPLAWDLWTKTFTLVIARRGGAEVAGWTLDRKIRVQFPAYPHRVWALWWQGGKRRLRTSRCPCWGRLGTLKTPSCPWRGCPAAGQNLETGHLSHHHIAEISLNVTLNHKQQTTTNLGHNFQTGSHIAHVYSLWQDLSLDTVIFDLITLTLKFDLHDLMKNFNLSHNFKIRSDRDFILHICIPCDNTFHMMVP